MADVSLKLDTTEYPLTVVDGTTLTLSLNGASGPSGPAGTNGATGPNAVSTSTTATSLNGYIFANGINIAGATGATPSAAANTLALRGVNGQVEFSSNDENVAALTVSNSGNSFDGVCPTINSYSNGSGISSTCGEDGGSAFYGSSPSFDFLAVSSGFHFSSPAANSGATAFTAGWSDPTGVAYLTIKDDGRVLVGGRTFNWPSIGGTVAVTNAAQSWSGTQTFSGAMVFTNATASTSTTTGALKVTGGVGIQGAINVGGASSFTNTARPTAANVTGTPASTDLITLGDSDTRYGTPYNLFLTSDISSSSTTFVDGSQTITLPAGTYEVDASLFGLTASPTGGVELNVKLSANNDTAVSIQVMKTANISANGSQAATLTTLRNGSSVLYVCFGTHADAANKACAVLVKGTFTLSASTILTPQVKQRTTTDAANAARFLSGSYLRFIKR